MTTDPGTRPLGADDGEVERVRRVTAEALMEHFAADRMPLEEFEERIDAVRSAESTEELRALLSGCL